MKSSVIQNVIQNERSSVNAIVMSEFDLTLQFDDCIAFCCWRPRAAGASVGPEDVKIYIYLDALGGFDRPTYRIWR